MQKIYGIHPELLLMVKDVVVKLGSGVPKSEAATHKAALQSRSLRQSDSRSASNTTTQAQMGGAPNQQTKEESK